MEKGCKRGLWLIRRAGSQGSVTWSPQGPRQQEKLRILFLFLKNSQLIVIYLSLHTASTVSALLSHMTCERGCHFCVFVRDVRNRINARSSVPSLFHLHKHNKHTQPADAAPLIPPAEVKQSTILSLFVSIFTYHGVLRGFLPTCNGAFVFVWTVFEWKAKQSSFVFMVFTWDNQWYEQAVKIV